MELWRCVNTAIRWLHEKKRNKRIISGRKECLLWLQMEVFFLPLGIKGESRIESMSVPLVKLRKNIRVKNSLDHEM